MASSPPQKTKISSLSLASLPLLLFIFVLLITILFFIKNTLEPTLSFYRDNLIWPHHTTTTTTTTITNPSVSSPSLFSNSSPPTPKIGLSQKGALIDDNAEKGSENFSPGPEIKSNDSISNGVDAGASDDSVQLSQKGGLIDDNAEKGSDNFSSVPVIKGDGSISNGFDAGIGDVSIQGALIGDNAEKGSANFSSGPENKSNSSISSGVYVGDGDVNWAKRDCDLYTGRWVKDEEYPIYRPGSCPFVDEAFDCQSNGRSDLEYLKWRWKPDGCDLPRFNATDFLERLRGKRLMLVGDSMNRNQFESILCLLHDSLSNKSRMYEIHGHKITKGRGYFVFKFEDYDCTVEFVRSHFLVREGTRVNGQGQSNPTLSIDRIDKSAGRWKRADILVFNTGHWWTHGKTARGKNYYKEGDIVYPKFDAIEAYKKAMRTWARWINQNINPKSQLIFFRGYSSAHFRGGDWDSGGTCNGETEPISSGAFLDTYPPKMKIVEEVIREMKVPVLLLNVTKLTNFRKDGHPSIYGKSPKEGRKVSTRKQDCSHWCLPGVPDAWNELIYASLFFQQTTPPARTN